MVSAISEGRKVGAMLPVRAPGDIEYLVKESEVITGQPGCQFVVSGADRLVYLIHWHPIGYKIQRLDAAENPICTLDMLAGEFQVHSLGEALRAGQLFTPPVSR
jgi:hypothetical protein